MTQGLLSQDVKPIKFADFQKLILKTNDTLYVVNFWATWCGPCIEELPYFNNIADRRGDRKIMIFTISLDSRARLSSVIEFLKRKPLRTATFLLDETDADAFIDKIDSRWSGAIPATVVFKNGKIVAFKEEKFESTDELESFIKTHY